MSLSVPRSREVWSIFFSLERIRNILAFHTGVNHSLYWINLSCDIIFMVDIIKNLNMGYVDETGTIIMDRGRAMKTYVKTWFLIDAVSSVPVSEILELAGGGGDNPMLSSKKALKMLRLVRMTKLVKLLRASQLVKKVRDAWTEALEYYNVHVSDTAVKLLKLFLAMLTLSHWGSCINYIIMKAYGYPNASWAVAWGIVRAGDGAPIYGVSHCYFWGIYKTLLLVVGDAFQEFPGAQMCTTVQGYCIVESWITLVGVFLGCVFNAGVVSTITAIIVSANVSVQDFEEQLLRTNEYMRTLHLPSELRDRIRDYY